MAVSPHDTVTDMTEAESQEIDIDLLTCLQEFDASPQDSYSVNDDLFDQLCGTQDMWNTLDMTNDLFHSLPPTQGYEEASSLATPPFSPPDSDTSPSPPVTNNAGHSATLVHNNTAASVPTVFPPSPGDDVTTPTPPVVVRNVQGQVVQVLRSGESVPGSMISQSNTVDNKVCHVDNNRKRSRSTSDKTVDANPKLSKKQQRLIKNRAAADISRKKKKEYVQSLECSLKEAAVKNSILLNENKALREQIMALQRENETLQTPHHDRGHVSRSAMVLMVVFCCGLAIFPLRSYLPTSSNSILSLTNPISPTGRALMSLPHTPLNEMSPYESHDTITSPPLKSHDSDVTESSVSTDRLLYRQCMRDLSGRKRTKCGCKCSAHGNKTRSLLLHSKLSTTLSDSKILAVSDHTSQENHASQTDHSSSHTQDDKSLIVVDKAIDEQYIGQAKCFCRSSELSRYFRNLKKSMIRDLSNFYLISFKDHVILDAPLHNKTHNPILSVIVPAHNETHRSPPGYMPMLQMDCEVFDTKIYHMPIP